MSWLLGLFGALTLMDAFDKPPLSTDDKWQIVVGLVLVTLAVVVHLVRGDDDWV